MIGTRCERFTCNHVCFQPPSLLPCPLQPLPPVLVQTLELVPAALVSWLVTNDGVAAPAQVPRLVEDAYGNGSGSVPAA